MTIISENEIKSHALDQIAEKMLLAARTAPKGRGADNLEMVIVKDATIKSVSEHMIAMGEKEDLASFVRDGKNILNAPVMILIGTKISSLGLKKCGLCGYGNCASKDKYPDIPCVFNTGDLGIAIGSAVSVAMDNRIDNRIMYTVGIAVKQMQLLHPDTKIIYAIPLSATSKNIFFDR